MTDHIDRTYTRDDLHDSIRHITLVNRTRSLRWHPKGLESWSMSDWATALAGEVGELCNVVKKLNRVRDDLPGNKESEDQLWESLRDEIADVYLYLDLFAQGAAHMDLAECVKVKFNKTSEKIGFPERL